MEIDPALYPADAESELEAKFNLPDRCLHIYDLEGVEARVDGDDEKMVRGAVLEFIHTGKDELLTFETVPAGGEYTIRVSRIADWLVSTANSRLVSRTVQAMLDRLKKERKLYDAGE